MDTGSVSASLPAVRAYVVVVFVFVLFCFVLFCVCVRVCLSLIPV